jgi:hypothetical protein
MPRSASRIRRKGRYFDPGRGSVALDPDLDPRLAGFGPTVDLAPVGWKIHPRRRAYRNQGRGGLDLIPNTGAAATFGPSL